MKIDNEFKDYLVQACKLSNSLYNSAVYIVRQHYYKQLEEDLKVVTYWRGDDYRIGRKLNIVQGINYNKLWEQLKKTDIVAGLGANASQQLLRSVDKSRKSYNALVRRYFENGGSRPRLSSYKKSGGLNVLTFDATNPSVSR